MKPENGIKKRIAERNSAEDNRESEKNQERRETEQFILVTKEQSWQEAVDIIAIRGFIRRID